MPASGVVCTVYGQGSNPYGFIKPDLSGLKWVRIGTRAKPDRELVCPRLASALEHKTELTQQEWDACGVKKLRHDDIIKSGDFYFMPAPHDDKKRLIFYISSSALLRAQQIKVGQRVTYAEGRCPKGKCAVNIELCEDSDDRSSHRSGDDEGNPESLEKNNNGWTAEQTGSGRLFYRNNRTGYTTLSTPVKDKSDCDSDRHDDAEEQKAWQHSNLCIDKTHAKAGYVFAKSLAKSLLSKYGITCSPVEIDKRLKSFTGRWYGTERMRDEWNAQHAEAAAAIEDANDRARRYNVRADFRVSALAAMTLSEALRMHQPRGPGSKTAAQGRSSPGLVALRGAFKSDIGTVEEEAEMAANAHVTKEDLILDISLEPMITDAYEGSARARIPLPSVAYHERLSLTHRAWTQLLDLKADSALLEKKMEDAGKSTGGSKGGGGGGGEGEIQLESTFRPARRRSAEEEEEERVHDAHTRCMLAASIRDRHKLAIAELEETLSKLEALRRATAVTPVTDRQLIKSTCGCNVCVQRGRAR